MNTKKKIISGIISATIALGLIPTATIAGTLGGAEGAIASVTIASATSYYDSFAEAISAAEAAASIATVKVLENVTTGSIGSLSGNAKGVVIDLSGYSIECTDKNFVSIGEPVTIMNSSDKEAVILSKASGDDGLININGNKDVTIDNVDVISKNDSEEAILVAEDSRASVNIKDNMIKGKITLGSSDVFIRDSIVGKIVANSDCDCMLAGNSETADIDMIGVGTLTVSDNTTVFGNVVNNSEGTIALGENTHITGDVINNFGRIEFNSDGVVVDGKTAIYSGTAILNSDKIDYICDNNGPVNVVATNYIEYTTDMDFNNSGNQIGGGIFLGEINVASDDCLMINDGVFNFDPTQYINDSSKVTIEKNTPTKGLYTVTNNVRIENIGLTICEDLTFRLKLNNDYVQVGESLKEVTLEAEMDGEQLKTSHDGVNYLISGINVSQIGSKLNIKIMAGEEMLSENIEYSVVQYCEALYHTEKNNVLNTLLANLIAYGRTLEKYWDNTTGNATRGERTSIPSYLEKLITRDYAQSSDNNKKVTSQLVSKTNIIKSAFLSITDKICVAFKIDAEVGNKVVITCDNQSVYEETIVEEWDQKIVYLDRITPLQYGVIYKAHIENPNGVILHGVEYSVNSYAFSKQNNEKVGEIAIAIFNFGKSAKEYSATIK